LVPHITSQLNEYSEVRSIPFDKVCTAYAVLVAARAEPMAVDVQLWNQGDNAFAHLVVEEQFAQALDLSVDLSAVMINDAAAGLGARSGEDRSIEAVAFFTGS
jgi:hypothetical protein